MEVATTLSQSWFRGHAKAVGKLVPRLFRPEYRDPLVQAFRPNLELETILAFKRHAAVVADIRLPAEEDRFGWLCIMQHYRTPTRLLDWTENALVALFFATSESNSEDGELWALLPWALNKKSTGAWGMPIVSESRHVQFMVDQPYWAKSPEKLAEKLTLDEPLSHAIAIEPPVLFPRMAVQASTFTIHPLPENSTSLEKSLDDPKHLVRYIIPSEVKGNILADLRTIGISQRHLFPDLEGLSGMIAYDNRVMAYTPPDPPHCAGEYKPEDEMAT